MEGLVQIKDREELWFQQQDILSKSPKKKMGESIKFPKLIELNDPYPGEPKWYRKGYAVIIYHKVNKDNDVVPVARLEAFRALKLSSLESFRTLKSSNLANGFEGHKSLQSGDGNYIAAAFVYNGW